MDQTKPPEENPLYSRDEREADFSNRSHRLTVLFKALDFVKKYIFDFFVIFISITASFSLTEWQRVNIHRKETITALKAVSKDLRIDTTNYNKIIHRLTEVEPILLQAMNNEIAADDVEKLQQLLSGLRAYHGRGVQKYGYLYLSNNIRNPSIKSKDLLHWIGLYHELSGPEGNFGGFNRDYNEITFDNHKRLFEVFPNYLHPDSTIARQSIIDNAEKFLVDPYWKARISLTYRQITSYNRPVYENNKKLAVKIIKMIEAENKANY